MDLKWQLALLSIRTRKFFQKTSRKITIIGSDTARYAKSKVKCFNYHKLGHFAREYRQPRNQDSRNMNQDSSKRTVNVKETASKAMMAIDGDGLNWSYMADDEVHTNMALMAFSDSEKSNLSFTKRMRVIFTQKLDLSNTLEEFQQPEFEGYGPKTSNSVSEDISNEVKESPDAPLVKELLSCDKLEKKTIFSTVAKIEFVRPKQQKKPVRKPVKNIAPRAVLMETGLRPLNTARPVNTAHPKTTVYSARPMSHFSKSAQSTIKRPYQIRTTLTNKNFSQKVNTAKGKFYTARPKAVNTARPNSIVVNAVRGNPQLELQEKGVINSRCSRHMTGNISYIFEYEEIDGGYVAFGGDPKGGKITGKGKINTDTECVVLSPDFKLLDESQVLLRVPRKNNMYNVDLKNIAPLGGLTCLFANATLDESNLWHRRLGHINFKTMNKLE
nr:ribonuclease H-like domain-containing protein [Tanacetum cinerariifolium]